MAKPSLSPAEKEKRKLERRAAKKAKRAEVKAAVASIEKPVTKRGKSKNPYQFVEVLMGDHASHNKIGQLREAGVPVRQVAFTSGYFVYEVPTSVTGFANYKASTTIPDKEGPAEKVKPLNTITDLLFVVSEKLDNKEKVNKRQIKLLVRGSELPRNKKKEAVTTLLKQFKIK